MYTNFIIYYSSISTSESQDQVESRFFLDVIIRESSSVFQLFSGKDKSLLIWWNTFFVLDFSFDIVNSIRWFDIKGDGFSGQSFDKDLHTSSKSQDQVESRFFLDVIIGESSSIFQLFSGKDKSLLIWWNTFFVLDFSFDIVN